MYENSNINNPLAIKKDKIITEALKQDVFSLDTMFTMIGDMDGSRALVKVEEVIADEKNSFEDLEEAFDRIEQSWKEESPELRRRALIAFFKRPDCPKAFITKYSKGVFPKTKPLA